MDNIPPLHILLIRHGKTNYTGIPPDLTDEGEIHVRSVAQSKVKEWMREHDIKLPKLNITSSPQARAHGTAMVIAQELGYKFSVTITSDLDAMRWKDKERCLLALGGHKGKGYIDYETEPIFADPTLFETPDEVRARWYDFLARYIEGTREGCRARNVIFVSHYEVFCNITRDVFGVIASKETALAYAEPIALSIVPTSDSHCTYISGKFRNETRSALFDLSSHVIQRT